MSGFNFPANTTAPSTGFSFSAPATTSAPAFSFGAPPAAATITTASGPTAFNFGATPTATPAPTLNFGTGQPQPLGLTTTPVAATSSTAPTGTTPAFGSSSLTLGGNTGGIGAGGGFSFGANTTTQPLGGASSFSLGSSLAPKTTAPTLALGAATTCAPSGILGIGAGGTGSNLITTTPSLTAPTTQSVGLGGISSTSSLQKSEQKTDMVAVKENKVPHEILKTVDDLKSYIKQQKTISSEIARTSVRKLTNVANDIDTLNYELQEISDSIQNNYMQIKSLRNETSKAIQNVEMAKQTSETPSSLQYENTAPLKFFQELIQKYENDLLILRNQIELTEKQMKSITHPQSLTPDDLKRGLKQIHECFIALAGRLHEIHRRVENAKEQYLNLRSNLTDETDDPFAEIDQDSHELDVSKIGTGGPSPFSMIAGLSLGKFGGTNNGGTGSGGGGVSTGGSNTKGTIIGIGGGIGSVGTIGTGFGSNAFNFGIGGSGTNTLSGLGTSTIAGTEESSFGIGLHLQKPPGAKRTKQ